MIEAKFLLQDADTQLFCSKSEKNPIGYTWVKDINLASHFDGASFSDAMSMISKHEKIHVNCITIPTATVLPESVQSNMDHQQNLELRYIVRGSSSDINKLIQIGEILGVDMEEV